MTKYKFRPGAAVPGFSAGQVATELARIADLRGNEPIAKAIVDESRPEEAVLHPAFEWDDEVAGERYREHQARNIVRSVQVVRPDNVQHPMFIHVKVMPTSTHQGGGNYERFDDVTADDFKLAALIADMRRRIAHAESALRDVERAIGKDRDSETLGMVAMMADALATARTLASRLQ